jgi:hypothetical protein
MEADKVAMLKKLEGIKETNASIENSPQYFLNKR